MRTSEYASISDWAHRHSMWESLWLYKSIWSHRPFPSRLPRCCSLLRARSQNPQNVSGYPGIMKDNSRVSKLFSHIPLTSFSFGTSERYDLSSISGPIRLLNYVFGFLLFACYFLRSDPKIFYSSGFCFNFS